MIPPLRAVHGVGWFRRMRPGWWLLSGVLASTPAGAVKIAVKGTATLEGQVQGDGEGQIVRGKLRDDLGAPVGGAKVRVEVVQADGKPLLALPPARGCPGGSAPQQQPDAYVLDTDAQGGFCLRTQRLPTRGGLRVRFAGREGLSTASLEVAFDAEHPAPMLAWDPRPETLDLDVPQLRLSVAGVGAEPLSMELLDERGKTLATAASDDRGRVLFDVATASLGGPGSGELVARVRGSQQAPLRAKVVRSAKVNLLASAPEGAIVPHDGHRFDVAVETLRGAAEGGVVEAKIGNETVGVGAVRGGRAEVRTVFDVPGEGAIDVVFRYVAAGPELKPGEGAVLRVAVRPPSLLRKAPLLLVGLLLVGWLWRGWKRPARAARERPRGQGVVEAGPLPAMVSEPEAQARGWSGVVLDAHEQRPLAEAVVRVVSRDFYGEREVASVQVDARGRFELEGSWEPARFLVVEAPWHGAIERALPKPGRLTLALVSRRRALLDRLIAAARRVGVNVASAPEPTPAQIAQAFTGQMRSGGARWAKAVEGAVFGASQVGAREEAQVNELEADLSRRDDGDGVRR